MPSPLALLRDTLPAAETGFGVLAFHGSCYQALAPYLIEVATSADEAMAQAGFYQDLRRSEDMPGTDYDCGAGIGDYHSVSVDGRFQYPVVGEGYAWAPFSLRLVSHFPADEAYPARIRAALGDQPKIVNHVVRVMSASVCELGVEIVPEDPCPLETLLRQRVMQARWLTLWERQPLPADVAHDRL